MDGWIDGYTYTHGYEYIYIYIHVHTYTYIKIHAHMHNENVGTCVLRMRRSADALFVSSSCSIFCSSTTTKELSTNNKQYKIMTSKCPEIIAHVRSASSGDSWIFDSST